MHTRLEYMHELASVHTYTLAIRIIHTYSRVVDPPHRPNYLELDLSYSQRFGISA